MNEARISFAVCGVFGMGCKVENFLYLAIDMSSLGKIFILIFIAIHAVFAQIDPCKDETQKAELFYEVCVMFEPQSSGYMDCVKLYMEQKAKAKEICKFIPPAPPAPWVAPEPPPAPPAPWQATAPAPVAAAPMPAPLAGEEPKEEKSEEEDMRLGIRVGFNINDFTFGYKILNRNIGIGMGFGAGLALNFPIASYFKLNAGLDFYYRQLFDGTVYISEFEGFGDMSEFVVSVPILFQLGKPFYFALGAQLDFPFISWNGYESEDGDYFEKNRSIFDFGIVLGFGYMFGNIGIDFKYVYGLTCLFEDFDYYKAVYKDKSSLMQYGVGVSYFF
jgi:hypothetical protein